jgi:hypothetical protein
VPNEPDELDESIEETELICWLDSGRVCGADCMAHTTVEAESKLLNEQQKHCAALVALERVGRHSGGIMMLLKSVGADLTRAAQRPPETPR